MSTSQIVEQYVTGRMGRRQFIRRLVGAGVSVAAAVSYAELLSPARAEAAHAVEDFYGCNGLYADQPVGGVRTHPATGVTGRQATLRGEVDAPGFAVPHWFEYRVQGAADPTFAATCAVVSTGQPGVPVAFTETITGLVPGTIYEFRAVVHDATGLVRGPLEGFVAVDPAPPATAAPIVAVPAAAPVAVPPPPPPAPSAGGGGTAPRSLTPKRVKLSTLLKRRKVVLEVENFDPGRVRARADWTYTERRKGRKPRKRTTTVARGSRRLGGDGGDVTLTLTRRGRALLAERDAVRLVFTVAGRVKGKSASRKTAATFRR